MMLRWLFSDNSCDLYTLDIKYVVSGNAISSTLPKVQKIEEKQLNKFLKSRLWNRAKTIWYCNEKWSKILLYENCTVQQKTRWITVNKEHNELQSTKNAMDYGQQRTQWITVNKKKNCSFFSLIYLLSNKARFGTLFQSWKPHLSSLFIRTWESLTSKKRIKHY